MADENICPRCHNPLPAGSPKGVCPKCLLKQGLAFDTIGYTAEDRATWTPPGVEQLAPLFPELDILELIGRGGMGAVYKAREKQLDRLVALKILPPEIGRDPAFAQRFAHEAQAMAKLGHPNIVTIHSFGQREELYFFIMEYVDGLSLRQLLDRGTAYGERGRTVSPKEALAIVPQICDALQYAHDRGIVHRDIKPENILLNRAGQVKIADFGLAKLVGLGATNLVGPAAGGAAPTAGAPTSDATQAGATVGGEKIMGTPQYMAPEQIDRPGEVDHRADIYSLGVVFYQMLTGELPRGKLGEKFEPPSRKVLIDVRLDEVVLRALEREPARRYQQVSEVKTQVETIVATSPGTTGVPPVIAEPAATSPRFSRLAIIGAIWACFTALYFVLFISGFRVRHPVGVVLGALITFLGYSAPLGTTICGAVAMSQIRRSSGRLHGLGLALADALLYPLLALNGIIGYCLVTLAELMIHVNLNQAASIIVAIPLCAFVDYLIIRWAWRAAKKPITPSPAPTAAGTSFPDTVPHQGDRARQAVKGPAIGLLVAAGINLAVILAITAMVLLIGTRRTVPPTFMSGDVSGSTVTTMPEADASPDQAGAAAPSGHNVQRASVLGFGFLIVPVLLGLPLSIIILWGAMRMMQLRNRSLAIAAAILAMIAAPGNIIGLPMGIWALVVLSRGEVIDAFEAVRGRQPPSPRASLAPALWAIVIHAVVLGAIFVALAFVEPKAEAVFAERGAKLPGLTVATIAASHSVRLWWFVLYPMLLLPDAGVCLLLQYFAGPRARRWWSAILALAAVLVIAMFALGVGLPFHSMKQAMVVSPDTGHPSMQAANSPWRVTLPSGVTVELIGVSENPSDGKPWWRPDGLPLAQAPFAGISAQVYSAQGDVAREFAVRLANLPPEEIDSRWAFDPQAIGSAGGGGEPTAQRSCPVLRLDILRLPPPGQVHGLPAPGVGRVPGA